MRGVSKEIEILLGMVIAIAVFVISLGVLGPMRAAEEEAYAAASLCNCFSNRPELYVLGMPPATDRGMIVMQTGQDLLRSCTIQICNCEDGEIATSSLSIEYGLEYGVDDFRDSSKDWSETVTLSEIPEFGEVMGRSGSKYLECSEIFNLFGNEGVFPYPAGTSINYAGTVFVKLKKDGRTVSQSSWGILYKHLKTVDT